MSFDNGSIDEVEGALLREGDVEDTEEGDEAGIHLVPPTSCLPHCSNEAQVLEDFVVKFLPSIIYASSVQ